MSDFSNEDESSSAILETVWFKSTLHFFKLFFLVKFLGGSGKGSVRGSVRSGFCTCISKIMISLESLRLMFASNYASHLNALIMPLVSALDKVKNVIQS